ncbi:D-alanyl-D-alanine carboxypeptidase/D-alanyl-D-alanine endopeptidase [Proteiniphilum sp. UBA1028]|jgi:D-alanyl-D-alanine carboxypeptidase/D-alanyl-D-alanine-endopeptidase (penicillin-binding protein 4)|uniref:D-alanyl-D-alanine carboxypeptidase/D-alanyl-D-alanine endopeptidase n=1 Tax=Proteiniphilum sp. UBA1028 TaxID=1947251 RepID=UPI0025CF514D|nr:D-alanyl-D-alanine carboxypeptidase/D-alanyl-D-alanine-endopeptidase [Proteiniphilum sp. UBA1028]
MQKNLIFFVFFVFTSVAYSQTTLQKLIDHPALKHASVGISVVDLETGKRVVAHDAGKSLTPASVLKLITTATALEVLGENYRYKTDVALDAEDPTRILIIGSGDPTLGSEAFHGNQNLFFITTADALMKVLQPEKEYSLYVVDDLFGYNGISPEWTWIDMGNYYAAGAYGISVFDNSYRLFFNTTDRNGCPRILRTEPQIKGLTFQNELTLNNTGRDNGYIYGMPFSSDRRVRGNIPAGRTEFSIKGDIPDPGLMLGETLAGYLVQAGLEIGKVETAREDYLAEHCVPEAKQPYRAGQVLCTHVSPPLKDIIREVNMESNNHYAEHLIRTIGRKSKNDIHDDALEAGITYVNKYWSNRGLEATSLQFYDGSGLAPQNAVSPQFLTDLLIYMYTKSENSSPFFGSLPKAGQEGTLTNFMANTRYRGKIAAKSGSIGGVQCYAGYLIDGRKKLAFAVMVNKFNGTRPQVRSAIEEFLLGL